MLNLFLSKMEAYQPKLQNLERAIEFDHDMESLLTEIAETQIRLRRLDQAESTLNRLLRRALEIAPGDSGIRNNYLRIKAALDRPTVNRNMQEATR